MTWKQCGPGGCATAPAPSDSVCSPSYRGLCPGDKPLDEIASVFANRILEAERCVLCAGWRDPVALNEAACDAGLTGGCFVDARHSLQLAYLCTCAELDRRPTTAEALAVAAKCPDVYLDADDLDDVLWRDAAYPSMLAMLTETVVENARQRERAHECLREAVGILTGAIGFDFDIIVRPRSSGRERGRWAT